MNIIPIGAVLTRRFYRVPDFTGYGDDFDALADAVEAAVNAWADYPSELAIRAPEVEERWVMTYPDGSTEFAVERTTIAPHLTNYAGGQAARREIRDRLVVQRRRLANATAVTA